MEVWIDEWIDRYAYRAWGEKGQITLECRDRCLLENGADVFGFFLCSSGSTWPKFRALW